MYFQISEQHGQQQMNGPPPTLEPQHGYPASNQRRAPDTHLIMALGQNHLHTDGIPHQPPEKEEI